MNYLVLFYKKRKTKADFKGGDEDGY